MKTHHLSSTKTGAAVAALTVLFFTGFADAKPKKEKTKNAPVALLEIEGTILDVTKKPGKGNPRGTATAVVTFELPVSDVAEPEVELIAEMIAELKFQVPIATDDKNGTALIGESLEGFIEVNVKQLDDLAKARGSISIGDEGSLVVAPGGKGTPPGELSGVEVYLLSGPKSGANRPKADLQFGESSRDSPSNLLFLLPKYLSDEKITYTIRGFGETTGESPSGF